jgi:hypothetical protein
MTSTVQGERVADGKLDREFTELARDAEFRLPFHQAQCFADARTGTRCNHSMQGRCA